MVFLDEKIAKLQKRAHMARKYYSAREKEIEQEKHEAVGNENIKELSQEEVTEAIRSGLLEQNQEKLTFENKIFFEGRLIIPMLKDYFDEYTENKQTYCWTKKHIFSVILTKVELTDDISDINGFEEKIKSFSKENNIYIELLNSKEEVYESYNKYIITLRMPTALDYIYQYIVYLKCEYEMIGLVFTCLEEDKKKWEKIMVGISELVEIKEGDMESNE